MKFSLILCTIRRVKEVEAFLEALNNQVYKNFELIIVDQNNNDTIPELIKPYQTIFTIKYLKSLPGLSKARNVALPYVTGDIIGIPDDDCIYPPNLLAEIFDFFSKNEYSGLTVKIKNSLNNGYNWPASDISKEMTIKDSFSTASCAIFFRKDVYDTIGAFDENLGPGNTSKIIPQEKIKILGGEDIDIFIRAIKNNYKCYYDSTITVKHPLLNLSLERKKNKNATLEYNKRMESAGISDYYVLKKHFSFFKRSIIIFNNIAGIFYYLLLKFDAPSSSRHFHRCKGLFYGIANLKQ